MASDWWNLDGPFAPLHRFNPVRLKFVRDVAFDHFQRKGAALRPFEGLSLLDLGCGGGLVAEPMARLGFAVTGVDAAEENIRAAAVHAEISGVQVTYRRGTAEELSDEAPRFDVVLAMEVLEHVAEPGRFIRTACTLVRPGGLIFLATINRTLKSLAFAKIAAEYALRWVPPGTHDWTRFIAPANLCLALQEAGLEVLQVQGMSFDILSRSWRLARDVDVNYVVVARLS